MFISRSGTLDITKLSQITGEGTQELGRWFFRLDESSIGEDPGKKCFDWYLDQPPPFTLDQRIPCPCSLFQAKLDRRYYTSFIESFSRFCVLSFRSVPWYDRSDVFILQECCYDLRFTSFGSLIVGPGNGGHQRLRALNPSSLGFISDDDAYKACCVESDQCEMFYEKRPSDFCTSYRPLMWSM